MRRFGIHVEVLSEYPLLRHAASTLILLQWLVTCFLSPLSLEAIRMNELQMDPTEIVKVPYDTTRLMFFVASTSIAIQITCNFGTTLAELQARLQDLIMLSMFILIIFMVAGAAPFSSLIHTASAAFYFAALCTYSSVFKVDTLPQKRMVNNNFFIRLFHCRTINSLFCSSNELGQDLIARHVSYGCIAAAIQMQILLLYDRGWQIQRWPVPIVLGSTLGWACGQVTSAIMIGKSCVKDSHRI